VTALRCGELRDNFACAYIGEAQEQLSPQQREHCTLDPTAVETAL